MDQYFASLSISETIFQTLSTGADISRLTLISSREVAKDTGVCQAVIITTEVIISTTDIADNSFLLDCFFKFIIFIILSMETEFSL